jgi:hypothetical protein
MNELIKAFSLLVKLKFIDRLAMRAKVTTSISLVPSMVHLVWLARVVIKPARLSRRTSITLF